ncbi:MAG: hypothetical protein ABI315_04910 [Bacteroidia bacterium]
MPLSFKSFIIIFLAIFIVPVFGQENNELKKLISETNNYYGANDLIYLGELYQPSNPFAKGTPFFTDRYLPAKVSIKNNVFENITTKYNIETDQLLLVAKTELGEIILITLKENWVDNFILDHHYFVNISKSQPTLNIKGYYELVFSGKKNLFIKYSNSFINTYSQLTPNGFYSKTKRRIYLSDHNNFIFIKNKKHFLNLYAKNKNEIKKYMRKNKIKFSNASSNQLNNLMQYCDGLSDTM